MTVQRRHNVIQKFKSFSVGLQVSITKGRKKKLYGDIRKYLISVFKELARQKGYVSHLTLAQRIGNIYICSKKNLRTRPKKDSDLKG